MLLYAGLGLEDRGLRLGFAGLVTSPPAMHGTTQKCFYGLIDQWALGHPSSQLMVRFHYLNSNKNYNTSLMVSYLLTEETFDKSCKGQRCTRRVALAIVTHHY